MSRIARVCFTMLALCIAAPPVHAQTAHSTAGDDLLGLWGAEPVFGPQVHGALTLTRRGAQWTMQVAGFEAVGTQQADSVVIALPGGQGVLRLWTGTGTGTPDAYWVQPEGAFPAYASPVRLHDTGPGAWHGKVAPIEARLPLYLMVSRADDGTVRGTFRNPSANWPGRVFSYNLQSHDDVLRFTDPRTGETHWQQPYDAAGRTISFDFGAPVILTPRTREQAIGFVTRSPALAPYRYRSPLALDDGRPVGDASAVGLSTQSLESLIRELVAVDPLNDTAPRIHSLLVARRGQLILDEYFHGDDAATPHDVRSASKTMTSIMVGAAQQHGARLSVTTPVGETGITLGHLLSHSSGQACNDDDGASPGNEEVMQSQQAQPDWYAYFMALPRVAAPGSTYGYCSAGVNMAGAVIGQTTGRWLPRVFETYLAGPMQFGRYGINLMPSGEAYSAGGMRLAPRDFLKFGQLYLDNGTWNSERLVPAEWVRTSTAHVISRDDGSDDGYGWHRHVLVAGGREYQTYEASGNGGEFLVVVPDLQLTVVVTAGNYGQYGVWRKIREQLVPQVMNAVR